VGIRRLCSCVQLALRLPPARCPMALSEPGSIAPLQRVEADLEAFVEFLAHSRSCVAERIGYVAAPGFPLAGKFATVVAEERKLLFDLTAAATKRAPASRTNAYVERTRPEYRLAILAHETEASYSTSKKATACSECIKCAEIPTHFALLRSGCGGFLNSSTPRMVGWTELTSCLSIASGIGYVPPARS
jgi:dienelactone hydrolase